MFGKLTLWKTTNLKNLVLWLRKLGFEETTNIQISEMTFLRSIKDCTLRDHIRKEDIGGELQITSLFYKLKSLQ